MPKNIIFCFDGTNNEPSDAKPNPDPFDHKKEKDSGITNVLKLHLMFGGSLENSFGTPQQQSFYYPGVGTYGGKLKRLLNAALAPTDGDIGTIIGRARSDLQKIYQAGDEIYIFGFSRGAAIARRFASLIHKEPQNYIQVTPGDMPIRFLGVFDTVASLGNPNLVGDLPKYDVKFQGGHTISPLVREALHLVSIDENRKPFMPTLMNSEDRVTEIWFPGVHSDIGGGYRIDSLSDVTLNFMIQYIERMTIVGVPLRIRKPEEIHYAALVAKKYVIDHDDLKVEPSDLGMIHKNNGIVETRKIRVLKNNKQASDLYPLIYSGVAQRVKNYPDYNHKALETCAHRLIDRDGSIRQDLTGNDRIFTGIRNYS